MDKKHLQILQTLLLKIQAATRQALKEIRDRPTSKAPEQPQQQQGHFYFKPENVKEITKKEQPPAKGEPFSFPTKAELIDSEREEDDSDIPF